MYGVFTLPTLVLEVRMRSTVAAIATLPVSSDTGRAAAATGNLPTPAPCAAQGAGGVTGGTKVDLATTEARGEATEPGPDATTTGH